MGQVAGRRQDEGRLVEQDGAGRAAAGPARSAPVAAPRRETLWGVAAMVACCAVWGLSAVYYKLLAHVPPAEILAHRTIWSAVLFTGVLAARRRIGALGALGRPRILGLVVFAAAMISINWFLFIFSVQAAHVVQTSMGYYIFPLVSVGFGALFFGERLSGVQRLAIGMAGAAVLVLILGLGVTPWVSLALAGSFGLYGVAKKIATMNAVASVTAEVLILSPLALAWLWLAVPGLGAFHGTTALLLLATGPLTAIPLILFSEASRRLSMASVGIIQYLNPSLQFLCAVALFGERFTLWHGVAFALIWSALALYSGEAAWAGRRVGRRARS